MFKHRDFSSLIGMKGFSEEMLENHFKLYEGYVQATNELLATLSDARKTGNIESRSSNEVRRRLGWEFNGMRLHEYYFENLGGNGRLDPGSRIAAMLVRSFGSLAAWEKDFRAAGAMRGIGWAILYQDPISGQLLDPWVNEHDSGHPAGAQPLVVLDVFEHAYMLDYGIRKDEYIDAFLANLDWKVVESRLSREVVSV